MARDWQVQFSHIWCEGNSYADALAKLGTKGLSSFTTWDSPPLDIHCLLSKDSKEIMYLRK